MVNFYKTVEGQLVELETYEEKVWINITNPTMKELQLVHQFTGVDFDFLRGPLDDEESSRIELENEEAFILVDVPYEDEDETGIVYDTIPLGIILKGKDVITVCLRETSAIQMFIEGRVKNFFTFKRNRFILQMLYRVSARYLYYLKKIDKKSSETENKLHRSMKNSELIHLLDLEKSLVYFSTSLKGNEVVLEKLLKMNVIRFYPEDEDLLEDVIIENKQAIEMATIYSNILSGMMDAFASVISNNLNMVMKTLTSITVVLSIPTMIYSFFGMNVPLPWMRDVNASWIILVMSLFLAIFVYVLLSKRKMF